MRVVGEIAHPELKITIFHWYNRYLIKLEAGLLEQTFKIHEYDVTSEEDLKKVVNEDFINAAIARFNEMAESLQNSLKNT
jgi:predicted secreted protein